MVELQHERSRELTTIAREQAERGEFESAQSSIREALELDPSNREAVQLRRRLQQDAQKQIIRPRIEAMLNSAKELMAGR
jgi:Arc/MetJ-type ribon-helix-helix transcriptional regulator